VDIHWNLPMRLEYPLCIYTSLTKVKMLACIRNASNTHERRSEI